MPSVKPPSIIHGTIHPSDPAYHWDSVSMSWAANHTYAYTGHKKKKPTSPVDEAKYDPASEPRYESPYVNYAEVNLRLCDTIIRYNGRPVWATIPSDGSTDLLVKDLLTEKKIRIQTGDPKLDVSSPPLGYINDPKAGTLYLMRGPDRLQNQGLYLDNMRTRCINGKTQVGRNINPAAICKAILNEYPEFKSARRATQNGKSMAWHRHFALGVVKGVPVVFGRGVGLGVYEPSSNTAYIRKASAGMPMVAGLEKWMKVHV